MHMVDNREEEEEAESNSTMKYDHENRVHDSVFAQEKLWDKLKIPKYEQKMDQLKYYNVDESKRVCRICSKVFNSGKALGGHMRIHVHQLKQSTSTNQDRIFKKKVSRIQSEEQNPRGVSTTDSAKSNVDGGGGGGNVIVVMEKEEKTCTICGKDFPSMKSLCGHMRCHPDREWRGIQPPSEKNSSSSSTLSEVEPSKINYGMEVLAGGERNRTGFTTPLRSWSRTARRGRKPTTTMPDISSSNDDVDDGFLGAVHELVMLARGGTTQEWINQENELSHASNDISATNTKFVMIKNKKKRKKVIKLCDLELEKRVNYNSSTVTSVQCQQLVSSDKCNNNNPMIKIQELDETAGNVKVEVSRKVLDFDLNEMPATEYEINYSW